MKGSTKEKWAETWAAITVLFRIWFPVKREYKYPPGYEFMSGSQWTPEEMKRLREARDSLIFNVLSRHK